MTTLGTLKPAGEGCGNKRAGFAGGRSIGVEQCGDVEMGTGKVAYEIAAGLTRRSDVDDEELLRNASMPILRPDIRLSLQFLSKDKALSHSFMKNGPFKFRPPLRP